MMQRAGKFKEYKNLCKGTKPSLSLASESNESFIAKSKCVDISMGDCVDMITSNVELINVLISLWVTVLT